jgi:CHAD domain-containing protein
VAKSVDEACRVLAAKCLRKQAKQLAAQLQGVRNAQEAECIHQARVASRRLRTALRMFGDCFKAKQLKRWRKQIRRVTARLGDARDKDVQIEFLCGVLHALDQKACYPGIARLLASLEQQRERLQPKVIKAAGRLEAGGVLKQMRAAAKQVLSEAQAQGVDLQSPLALGVTRRHILDNLGRLLPYQASLADPEDRQRHHAMRIAAKRLRYTLEISAPVYAGQLDGAVDAIKRVQTLLGEVHDCDVWDEQLQAFAGKLRKRIRKHFGDAGRFARLEVGIQYVQEHRRRRRQQAFQELVDYWQELNRRREWERLVETVRAPGARTVVPEPLIEPASPTTARPETDREQPHGREAGGDSPQESRSGARPLRGPKRRAQVVVTTPASEAQGR